MARHKYSKWYARFGKKVKEVYPGYEDLEDEALGRAVAEDYPDMWDTWRMTSALVQLPLPKSSEPALPPIPGIDIDTDFKKANQDLQNINEINTPGSGFFSKRWKNLTAEEDVLIQEKQNKLRAGVTAQLTNEHAIAQAKVNLLLLPERTKRQVENERINHLDGVEQQKRKMRVEELALQLQEIATSKGRDLPTHALMVPVEEAARLEKEVTTHAVKETVRKEVKLTALKLSEQKKQNLLAREQKEKLDKLELDKEKQAALNEIDANFIIQFGQDQYRIKMIQHDLDALYDEMHELQFNTPKGWVHKLKDRQKTVKALKEEQDALRKGLRQNNQQQTVGGTGTP